MAAGLGSCRPCRAWREFPGRGDRCWRCPWLLPALEGLDHDHVTAAAWARRAMVDRFVGVVVGRFERNLEQLAGKRQAGPASRASQQTVMPDAVEPAQQDVEQEPLDERDGGECHDPLPLGAVAAIILVAKGERKSTRVNSNH